MSDIPSVTSFDALSEDHASVKAFVDTFSDHVAVLGFDAAAEQFDDNVVSFSSFRDVVVGKSQFVNEQWRNVWPTMTDFHFKLRPRVEIKTGQRYGAMSPYVAPEA